MIVFPFVSLYSENLGIVNRPIANVLLIGPLRKVVTEMLIDSGADVSLISYKQGLRLGFKIEKGEDILRLGGISGGIPVIYRDLEMQIGEVLFKAKIAWSLNEDIPEILGRANVFDVFDIELKQAEKVTIFRKR